VNDGDFIQGGSQSGTTGGAATHNHVSSQIRKLGGGPKQDKAAAGRRLK